MNNIVIKTEEEWQETLTPKQYQIARQKGTEAPFTGKFYKSKETGDFHCVACGHKLFSSKTKFESGTGWPSFTDPATKDSVEIKEDTSHGLVRKEVTCKKCGAHLGHVFEDGPGSSGQRYCINSEILELKK